MTAAAVVVVVTAFILGAAVGSLLARDLTRNIAANDETAADEALAYIGDALEAKRAQRDRELRERHPARHGLGER